MRVIYLLAILLLAGCGDGGGGGDGGQGGAVDFFADEFGGTHICNIENGDNVGGGTQTFFCDADGNVVGDGSGNPITTNVQPTPVPTELPG